MPCTNTPRKVIMQLPLTAKGINNNEALMFDKHSVIIMYHSLGKIHCWIFSCENLFMVNSFVSWGIRRNILTMNYFKVNFLFCSSQT